MSGTQNQELRTLIGDLKRETYAQKAGIWKRIASDLEKPSRQRRVVNLSKISRYTKDNETIIVPGKVLGAGAMQHSVVVAAFSFSDSARQEIEKAKGKCITIKELIKQNPKGKDVRIIG